MLARRPNGERLWAPDNPARKTNIERGAESGSSVHWLDCIESVVKCPGLDAIGEFSISDVSETDRDSVKVHPFRLWHEICKRCSFRSTRIS